MSVEDESWDRPICEHCKKPIGYGMSRQHQNGRCLKSHEDRRNQDLKDILDAAIKAGIPQGPHLVSDIIALLEAFRP